MALSTEIKEKISLEVIKTLFSRFGNYPEDSSDNRNAPFHQAFLQAFSDKFDGKVPDIPFFISLSSWLHGLNTTLGLTFFEKVAHHLCSGEKREYTSKKLGNLNITQAQRDNIVRIVADLSNSTKSPDLEYENGLIFLLPNDTLIKASDFSTDVFTEDNDTITAIELKSVRPNSGEMKGEKLKILEGKAALFKKYPDKNINFYIGFPFDPSVDPGNEPITSSHKERFMNFNINMEKYFSSDELLIADELWDFLSQEENTMQQILDIINAISTTGFINQYQFLNDNNNRTKEEYKLLLEQWNLSSEADLIENEETISHRIRQDKRLIKIYNKHPFDATANYNYDRYVCLRDLYQ